ncbi:MAG: hypothetical protein A2293_05960 [Elusimicrobia bacterium RIFOXYB2_FULL_49_7]|nr:MAG: hypothetical protein A2293_05960 [Elusimicrobia bacterium RIFOXYB2_FULL_49_7]
MIKTALFLCLSLLLGGCASDLKLSAFDASVKNKPISQVVLLQLPGSSYPMHHNIVAVKTYDFPTLCINALEKVVQSKRKGWKLIPPSTAVAADPEISRLIPLDQQAQRDLPPEVKEEMKKDGALLETCHFMAIEAISVKDVGTPQAPGLLVVGVCLQIWDFQEGKLVYRARNTTRPINYVEKDFTDKADDALFDLFRELLSPLPQ